MGKGNLLKGFMHFMYYANMELTGNKSEFQPGMSHIINKTIIPVFGLMSLGLIANVCMLITGNVALTVIFGLVIVVLVLRRYIRFVRDAIAVPAYDMLYKKYGRYSKAKAFVRYFFSLLLIFVWLFFSIGLFALFGAVCAYRLN